MHLTSAKSNQISGIHNAIACFSISNPVKSLRWLLLAGVAFS